MKKGTIIPNRKHGPLQLRFEKKIQKGDSNDDCWRWLGYINKDGYGSIYSGANKKNISAHRASYEIHIGPIPDGMEVCHECDVRDCVNPLHLKLGTHDDNMKDMKNKKRASTTPKHSMPGEKSHFAKLNNESVIEMRRLHRDEGVTYNELSEMFNVTPHHAHGIINRKKWKHI